MPPCRVTFFGVAGALILVVLPATAAEVTVIVRPPDPYGCPRPAADQPHVPLQTSFYLELGIKDGAKGDAVLPESISIRLQPEGGQAFEILKAGRQFSSGYPGKFLSGSSAKDGPSLIVYVDSESKLLPSTRYTIQIAAKSRHGAQLPAKAGSWQFVTEAKPVERAVSFDLSLDSAPVRWHGGFFTGFCSPGFCTSATNRIPTYELMDQVRKWSPRAWSLQRDFWMTGMEHQPGFLTINLPNIVREVETRRITAIEDCKDGMLLRVEDVFGHEQYGIPSNRAVSGDYHKGDEVLIADGVHSARARVLDTDDRDRAVLVAKFAAPPEGWKLRYSQPLPKSENKQAPGLFPPGGCYLRKFAPCGTPAYYWGRLDAEWDISHRRFHRRLSVNFADAPGDLSIDGRDWTTAKDYVELHTVVHAITSHLLDRYGADCYDFSWSVFNEPDLGVLFWRASWDELQKFYDYTVDAILRAFEDKGYDSGRVFISGLELGGIFGVHLRTREFLVHCSPRAKAEKGALLVNAAFADKRLDGKRSRRVEKLCGAHQGRGSPCDFISIHAYNRAHLMADKLAKAKETALEIDPDYYARLWVNSHEACPNWLPPPDPAFADSYLGNGYYPTWCADVTRRQLQRAKADPRYAFGETILTFWPWPCKNFQGMNDCVRAIDVDDHDGVVGRVATIPMPILHFLGLLAGMGPDYHVLPEQTFGGHAVSGFATHNNGKVQVLLYTHQPEDTESRSEATFAVTLKLANLHGRRYTVREHRFDKDHNSYFRLGRRLRDRSEPRRSPEMDQKLREALKGLESADEKVQLASLEQIARLGPSAGEASQPVLHLLQTATSDRVRGKALMVLQRTNAGRPYSAVEIKPVIEQSALQVTRSSKAIADKDGRMTLQVKLSGNGANILNLEPAAGSADAP